MKERLIKNYITTVIGLMILALGTYLLIKGVIQFEVYIASMPTIFLLFRAKDSLLGGSQQGGFERRFDDDDDRNDGRFIG